MVAGIKNSDLLFWGAVAVGGFLLYRALAPIISGIGSTAGAITSGVNAASSGIANLWVRLTTASPMNVLGTVQFPNGNQAAISSLPVKTDGQGGIYVNSGGITYQLQPWVMADDGVTPVYPAVAVGT